MSTQDVHGILLLDKPLGLSSAAAVARIKRLFDARKAGHTGSLDPLASGMLPICLRRSHQVRRADARRRQDLPVTVRLGERTPSADRESTVIERRELPPLTVLDLERALAEFPRDYAQVPPMHSAIKQDGKPLYEYARAGETRERAARSIVIHDMQLIDWQSPDLSFDVRCTKGAYIRVLAEDLAARLETIGHLVGAAPSRASRHSRGCANGPSRPWRHVAGRAQLGCCCRWMRRSATGGGSISRRRGSSAFRQGRSVPVDRANAPETCASMRPGLGFLGLGAVEAAGRLGAAAAYFGGYESSLRAGAATRTMRAFLKGLSY